MDRKMLTIILVICAVMSGVLIGLGIAAENRREEIDIPETTDVGSIEPMPNAKSPEILEYYDVPLDEDLQSFIFGRCERHNIDPAIVFAMIERESQFDIYAIGDNGNSYGLMQIQPKWHAERMARLGCDDLLDPYQNVEVGIDILAELIAMDRGIEWALMAYNGGYSYANALVRSGEVSEYAREVLNADLEWRAYV